MQFYTFVVPFPENRLNDVMRAEMLFRNLFKRLPTGSVKLYRHWLSGFFTFTS